MIKEKMVNQTFDLIPNKIIFSGWKCIQKLEKFSGETEYLVHVGGHFFRSGVP